ncbi:hypothetical protein HGRIS_013857 [Hohenbuehelia grisea]|uniref:Uncharacterized protein n=1 Tax=Hohenbuehelia grisea TaxID=104357 RepID=A0ABR3IWY0_9AGAR
MANGYLPYFDNSGRIGQPYSQPYGHFAPTHASGYYPSQNPPSFATHGQRYPGSGHTSGQAAYNVTYPSSYTQQPFPQESRSPFVPTYRPPEVNPDTPYASIASWPRERTMSSGGASKMPRPKAYGPVHQRSFSEASHFPMDSRSPWAIGHHHAHQYAQQAHPPSNQHPSPYNPFPAHEPAPHFNPFARREPAYDDARYYKSSKHHTTAFPPPVHPTDLARQFAAHHLEPTPDHALRRTRSEHASYIPPVPMPEKGRSDDEREARRARRALERERRKAEEADAPAPRAHRSDRHKSDSDHHSRTKVPDLVVDPSSERRSRTKSDSAYPAETSKSHRSKLKISGILSVPFMAPKPRRSSSRPTEPPPIPSPFLPPDHHRAHKKTSHPLGVFIPPEDDHHHSQPRADERRSRRRSEYPSQAIPDFNDENSHFASDPITDSYFSKPKKTKQDKYPPPDVMVIPPERDGRYPTSRPIVVAPSGFSDAEPLTEANLRRRDRKRDKASRRETEDHPRSMARTARSESPPALYLHPPTPQSTNTIPIPVPPPRSVVVNDQ